MQFIKERYTFLFRSTKGLILTAIAAIALTTAFFGTLSGPMEGLGIKDFLVKNVGLSLHPADREGRIIILYHSIAMAVVAIETYMINALYPMKAEEKTRINATITVGYLVSLIFGLLFAYFGKNYVFHGLFIAGQSLIFFAGAMLAVALWPWQKAYLIQDPDKARTRGGVDIERVALFVMAMSTLGSVLFGAIPGSLFGNGFESFLAEDIIREPVKNVMERAVVGHLHIMLTLIAIALTLILSRWFDFKGKLHKWAMPLMIVGTIIITIGVWIIVPYQPAAHIIINVGSAPVLVVSVMLSYFGWRKMIRQQLGEKITKSTLGQKISAVLHDPIKFGALWQMIYMNFVVTFVGIFMAVRLDKVIRTWPAREERIILTGHWHVLAAIIATIILLYYADLSGLKGKLRQWFGWIVIIASDVSFAAVALFETKRLYVDEVNQQSMVDFTILLTDAGVAVTLLALAALMIWRLIDLFKHKGRWSVETGKIEIDSQEGAQ